ncbi:serine--tRNA ligase [Methyloceanibacter marginalis]|uniref:Serine--tRNA ligase n=1 Tax=Methyloceanibacter marginalis TaxID=1774971 RepID=A0A1E3WDI0_9HYPH|nr:serine--tRNA ligase [Methyloceanibacter marginalis]ODS03127.1 serine--tRNA ligase [Methyloceanibacter marginalis]
MLDVKWIRDNQDAFVKGLSDRGFGDPKATLTQILTMDEQRRETIQALQELQATRNAASKDIGKAKQAKDEAEAKRLMDEVAGLKATIQEGEDKEREQDKALHDLLAGIPNMPADGVPVGPDESANVELRKVGAPPKFSFAPKEHFEIGEALGLMDFETAAKLSGARFVVLKGKLARLERALAQFMLDLHTDQHGYTEVNPPLLVRDDTMFGTAQLPKFEEDQFVATNVEYIQHAANEYLKSLAPSIREQLERASEAKERDPVAEYADRAFVTMMAHFADLAGAVQTRRWLIPTAEVPLTNLVREDITDEAKLPMRVTAGTPCFRAEAGAAGKDTRGMIRQHQFSKVELVSVTTPEQSAEEHERMTKCAETVLQRLGLPYRVVVLSTGDMGFAAKKTYDIEVWLPGQDTYREISSCSNCGDFQARRMNARYRPKDSKATQFVHTLNGSGVAVGRALIAVLENYQNEDGSVRVPDALQPYMGGVTRIEAAK